MTNEQLVLRIAAGIDEAENMLQLWQNNKNFVIKMAMKYQGYVEQEDLIQEGYIGLCEAVQHYDSKKSVQFITYAAFWIRQAMVRYLENYGNMVRIPSGVWQQLFRYKKIYGEYVKYYGREPSDYEMQGFLGISAKKLADIKHGLRMTEIHSINESVGDEEGKELGEFIASNQNLEEECCRKHDYETMKKALWESVNQLPEEQADVICKRYQEQKTRDEIGKEIGTTSQQVYSLEDKALRTLRIPSNCERYKSYFEEYLSGSCFNHVGISKFRRTWTSAVEEEVLKRVL